MKKGFEIFAVDQDMANRARALVLLNEVKRLGFVERKAFVNVVLEKMPHMDNIHDVNKLRNFWATREFSINEEVELVLDLLNLE